MLTHFTILQTTHRNSLYQKVFQAVYGHFLSTMDPIEYHPTLVKNKKILTGPNVIVPTSLVDSMKNLILQTVLHRRHVKGYKDN